MPSLKIQNFVGSGLGDRLCGVALISLYARVKGYDTVYLNWPGYSAPHFPGAPPHRTEDIKLENILSYLRLPQNIKVEEPPVDAYTWTHELGIGKVDVAWLHKTYLPHVSVEITMALNAVLVRKDFKWSKAVLDIVDVLAYKPFVAIHIRRTDKNLDMPVENLEIRTLQHINDLIRQGARNFFICTDDGVVGEIITCLLRKKGASVITLPENLEKWQTSFYDIAMMSRAEAIVQSCRTSSFSNFAHFLGNNRLINVQSKILA